jgi:hypothetical protein
MSASSHSFISTFTSLVDQSAFEKYFFYNFSGKSISSASKLSSFVEYNFFNENFSNKYDFNLALSDHLARNIFHSTSFNKLISYSSLGGIATTIGDYASSAHSHAYTLPNSSEKFTASFFPTLNKSNLELGGGTTNSYFLSNLLNTFRNYKYKDIRSQNQQFLSIDKDVRNMSNSSLVNLRYNFEFPSHQSNLVNVLYNSSNIILSNYSNSLGGFSGDYLLPKLSSSNLSTSITAPTLTSATAD